MFVYGGVCNRQSRILLTNTGVPPEDVPVKDVEGEMSEATWNLTVEILPIERAGEERRGEERREEANDERIISSDQAFLYKHKCCFAYSAVKR